MTQGELFEPHGGKVDTTEQKDDVATQRDTQDQARTDRVINSALWASWADALGFISELTSEAGLKRRLRGRELNRPMAWKRRVGGRGGPQMELPAGTYSDDTQLRLASGRCISSRGFDVEAFAHVELPAWLAYALGGGVGTKAAAVRMMKPAAVWYAGQHEGWTHGGGNGAAMRIQPHVWASTVVAGRGPWLSGMLADACTTHAHPRALLGAALHAYTLSIALSSGRVPDPEIWVDLVDAAAGDALDEMKAHPEIGDYWVGSYDKAAKSEGGPAFVDAWCHTADEMRNQVKLAVDHSNSNAKDSDRYSGIVERLGLKDPATRGSGSATSIAALALSWMHQDSPEQAAQRAASELHTDTDTIATMAGALTGAANPDSPSTSLEDGEDFSDRNYIRLEAKRLAGVASGSPMSPALKYPDLLTWSLPRAQGDLIGQHGGELWLAGMSRLRPVEGVKPAQRGEFVWRWFITEWNQHLLAKFRHQPRSLSSELMPTSASHEAAQRGDKDGPRTPTEPSVAEPGEVRGSDGRVTGRTALEWLERRGFAQEAIGYAVTQMALSSNKEEFASFAQLLHTELIRRGMGRST